MHIQSDTKELFLNKSDMLKIFVLAFSVRVLWALLSGIPASSGPDFLRYDNFSNNILNGNFNLKLDSFIVAPLFPYLLAAFKFAFGESWSYPISTFQIIISSIAAIFLGSTSLILFEKRSIAITSALLYSLSLPTLYFVHTASQESFFQSVLVISSYFVTRFCITRDRKNLIAFSILFTFALLTKSHIILSIPLWLIFIFLLRKDIKKSLIDSLILLSTIFFITLPYGVYNLQTNGMYIISSSGGGFHFLTGHNEDFYKFMVNTPEKNSQEYNRLLSMEFKIFDKTKLDSNTSHKQGQSKYFKAGKEWITANPWKAANLLIYNFVNHLRPGYSLRYHPFSAWLVALIFQLPIYFFAYMELLVSLRNPTNHFPAYVLFITMLMFALIFYSQSRFRAITVEPVYLLYASPQINTIFRKIFKVTTVQ